MSDIKRHKAAGNGVVKADPKGDLVLYIDYARLKEQHDFYKSKWEEKNDRLFRIINLEQENARLKESLRLQIEQNALAQVGFKMYQNNVDSGGLHKDRKDAIARLEAENARLKAEVERLTKAGDLCDQLLACFEMEGRRGVNIGRDMWREAKGVQS